MSLRFDQAFPDGEQHELGGRVYAERVHEVGPMDRDGVGAPGTDAGDLLVRLPQSEQGQHFDRGVEPVDLRHREIHHDDVWRERPFQLDGFGAAARFARDDHVGLVFENAPEPLPHERMIVGQQHTDAPATHVSTAVRPVPTAWGTRTSTTSPPSAGWRNRNCPPISSARSRMLTSPRPRSAVRTPADGSPWPASSIARSSASPSHAMRTRALSEPEWRPILLRASWTMRYTWIAESGGMAAIGPDATSVVRIPVCRSNCSTERPSAFSSPKSSSTPGC